MTEFTSIAAFISSLVALAGVVFSYIKMRQDLQRIKLEQRKIEAQYGQELSAERAARKLLECTRWKRRTFQALKYHMGGYDDDELRRILIRAGAIRFKEDVETWGLIERNETVLEEEWFTDSF